MHFIPFIIPLFRPGEEDRSISQERLRKNERLYNEYCALIQKHFVAKGLFEYKYRDNDDPWAPGHHWIVLKDQRSFLHIIPYKKNVAVMEILSEPKFSEGMSGNHIPQQGLKIRIAHPEYKKQIIRFAEEYESIFKEKVKIY